MRRHSRETTGQRQCDGGFGLHGCRMDKRLGSRANRSIARKKYRYRTAANRSRSSVAATPSEEPTNLEKKYPLEQPPRNYR